MKKYARLAMGLAGVVTISLFVLTADRATARLLASPQQPQSPSPETGQSSSQPMMAEMMKRHQQMTADMKAADSKLDELVIAMNAAIGERKFTAMAQVVNELARQQKTMHENMGMMDQHMMMRMTGGRGMMHGK